MAYNSLRSHLTSNVNNCKSDTTPGTISSKNVNYNKYNKCEEGGSSPRLPALNSSSQNFIWLAPLEFDRTLSSGNSVPKNEWTCASCCLPSSRTRGERPTPLGVYQLYPRSTCRPNRYRRQCQTLSSNSRAINRIFVLALTFPVLGLCHAGQYYSPLAVIVQDTEVATAAKPLQSKGKRIECVCDLSGFHCQNWRRQNV